jgi:hypothetical protein
MKELALFASAFTSVFALGFQQQNVIHRHYLAAAVTSFVIGSALIYQWRAMPSAAPSEILATLLGGPCGITAAMWLHPRLMRKARKNNHA